VVIPELLGLVLAYLLVVACLLVVV